MNKTPNKSIKKISNKLPVKAQIGTNSIREDAIKINAIKIQAHTIPDNLPLAPFYTLIVD